MSVPVAPSQAPRGAGPGSVSPADLPDAPRVQDQFAGLAEAGELRPMLEFLRALLNARAVALFPAAGGEALASVIVTTRGILATSLAPLGEKLAASTVASIEPAPALGSDGYSLAVPLGREGRPAWILLAQLVVGNPRDLQAWLVVLQGAAGFFLYREQRAATADMRWILERAGGLLDVFRKVGGEEDHAKARRIAVDALRDYLGCSRVSFGGKSGAGVRIRAISGVRQPDAKSPAHQPLEAAMSEALREGRRVDFTHADAGRGPAVAHELLQRETRAVRITTLPLLHGSGALSLEWDAEPDRRTPALLDAALPFVPCLFDLLDRAKPNPVVHFFRSNWRRAQANARRAIVIGASALAVLLAFPFHHTIRADCRLVPRVKRTVAAPFDGQLGRSLVQPGDRVAAGAPLVGMDNRELKLKQAELSAGRDQALKKRDRAMSNPDGADFSAAQVATFEAEGILQELALVERKLAMLDVHSPIDGVVVSGDLRRAEGQPIRQGEVLFEIAPLDAMLVEVDVPDRDVSRVRAGMPVSFRLDAFGGWRGESTIERLHPHSEQRDGANVFIAEAPVMEAAAALRPGMRGRAAIEGDRRQLVWILGHRMVEWIETALLW